jgi:hypothetical membrane protein
MMLDTRRIGTTCGLLGPSVFMVLYVLAMANDHEYTFFENWLSDLGVGAAAWAFNSAVIIAGCLTIPFALLALRPVLGGGIIVDLAVGFTLGGAVFLILVGIYTEDYEDLHSIVSVGFFLSMQIALLFYSLSFYRAPVLGKDITWFTVAVFALGAGLIAMGFDPQTETVAVLAIVLWGLVVAAAIMWRGPGTPIS